MDDLILEQFYENIIPGARVGQIAIDTYDPIFMAFNCVVNEDNRAYLNAEIPTLIIHNETLFNQLLIKYTKEALNFYTANIYDTLDTKIRRILCCLWANATSADFQNPCQYLEKRINFFNSACLPQEYATSLGYLQITCKKEVIYQETPYSLNFKIDDNVLPLVRYGISDNNIYIYAIHNVTDKRDKKFNRALYQLNAGLDLTKEETDNILYPENIKGITPASLLSAALALFYFKSLGFDHVIIPTYLPERWYNKSKSLELRAKVLKEDNQATLESIQRNITDKFIRTFRRLAVQCNNMEISALPYLEDEYMHLLINDEELRGDNPLLAELFNLFNQKTFKK